jgi:hypothetical protein
MATVTKFTSLPAKLLNKEVDWDTDTIKLMLVDAGYTFSAAHDYKADIDAISGAEVTGTGYTAGGVTLGTKAVTVVSGTTHFTAANAAWASSTISATGAILYVDTGSAATSALLCYIDFEGTVASSDGAFTVDWSDTGAAGTVFTLG